MRFFSRSSSQLFRKFLPGLGVVLSLLAGRIQAEIRTWTDGDGRTVRAEFVVLDGERVTLRSERSGRLLEFPLEALSPEDQHWIRARYAGTGPGKVIVLRGEGASDPVGTPEERGVPEAGSAPAEGWEGRVREILDGLRGAVPDELGERFPDSWTIPAGAGALLLALAASFMLVSLVQALMVHLAARVVGVAQGFPRSFAAWLVGLLVLALVHFGLNLVMIRFPLDDSVWLFPKIGLGLLVPSVVYGKFFGEGCLVGFLVHLASVLLNVCGGLLLLAGLHLWQFG